MAGWGYWGLTFWCGLVLAQYGPQLGILDVPLAIVASLLLVIAGSLVYRFVLAPPIASMKAALAVPPPPERSEVDEGYLVRPRPIYPAIELLRGQCGWVLLRLRVDRSGRIRAFQIVEQAPGRLFERSVVQALRAARLSAGVTREVTSLVSFVTEGDGIPAWAAERLPADVARS